MIINDEQLDVLLEACEGRPMLHLYVLFLAETGARSESEALWTQWDDVDLEEGFVWIGGGRDGHRTKSGKGRWVPLTKRVEGALREHAARFQMATYEGERTP